MNINKKSYEYNNKNKKLKNKIKDNDLIIPELDKGNTIVIRKQGNKIKERKIVLQKYHIKKSNITTQTSSKQK